MSGVFLLFATTLYEGDDNQVISGSICVNLYTFVGTWVPGHPPCSNGQGTHNGSPGTHKDYQGIQNGFDRLGNPNSFDNV